MRFHLAGMVAWVSLSGCASEPGEGPGFQFHTVAFPPPSGSCSIRSEAGLETRVDWDADTLHLSLGNTRYRLDENARMVERIRDSEQVFLAYDERGTLTHYRYIWDGVEVARNGWVQTNEYDSSGRLVSSEITSGDGLQRTTETREYRDGRLLRIVRETRVPDSETSVAVRRFGWAHGFVTDVYQEDSSRVWSHQEVFHDVAGRLTRIDVDGAGFILGPDGKPDIRVTWSYDFSDRILGREQDGTEELDAPIIDGKPDAVSGFDAACADIAVLPSEIYALPSWLWEI
jgi:hypothetical protein